MDLLILWAIAEDSIVALLIFWQMVKWLPLQLEEHTCLLFCTETILTVKNVAMLSQRKTETACL